MRQVMSEEAWHTPGCAPWCVQVAILNSRRSISRVNVYFRGPPASQLWRLFLGLEGFPLGRQGTPTGPIPFPRLTLEVLQTESCVPGSQGRWDQEGVLGPLPSWPLGLSGLPRCVCVIVGGGGRKDCREQRMQDAGVLGMEHRSGAGGGLLCPADVHTHPRWRG